VNQRDALLEGAKKCLVEKGHGHTTARDIAAASGAHLGSIGYHFGSKDHLMSLAAIELTSEWGDTVERAARASGGETPGERLVALLSELLDALPASHDLQSAGLQALAQSQFDDGLRAVLADGQGQGRAVMASVVLGREDLDPGSPEARGVGSLVYAIVIGLVAQAFVNPEALPDSERVTGALGLLRESDNAADAK